jgi:GcrA cell cycle regulator
MRTESNAWTEAELQRLRDLWAAGKTAQEIADELGNKTRSAVLGRAHRSKLPTRISPVKQKAIEKKTEKRVKKTAAAPVLFETAPPCATLDKPPANLVSLLDLKTGQCAWPYGDPKESGFGFCGQSCQAGSQYCAGHHKRVFQPAWRKDNQIDRVAEMMGVKQ